MHESLPIYSGGSGNPCGGSSEEFERDRSCRWWAWGLLYRNGYFQQYLTADGWQQEAYPELDFYNLPIEELRYPDGSAVLIHRGDAGQSKCIARCGKLRSGGFRCYLLDTNLADNAPADREITSRLYGGGTEMRIKQEIVLGIGGVRALEAMNISPSVFHMNEGHSAFLALERIRVLLKNSPLTFDQARQMVMGSCVFTTHTPVPAGIDHFHPDLVVKYFRGYVRRVEAG